MNGIFLSSHEIYQITAVVSGKFLDDYAIISQDDEIRPHFLKAINDDPDLKGLTIYLKTAGGRTLESKIRYTTEAEPNSLPSEPTPVGIIEEKKTEPAQIAPDTMPVDSPPDAPVIPSPESELSTPVSDEPPQDVPAVDTAVAVPSVRAPAETPEEAAEVVPEGPEGQNSGGQVMPEVPPQESPAVDLPAADTPIAAAAEPSPVVPAMSPPLPSPASTPALIPEAEKTEDQIFYVKRIDRSLPFFKMPQDLAMGQYYFVFQVEGEKDILYQTEKAFYFLGDAEFAINDIAAYPPGFSESHTVPPGTIIMLDVQVLADERLDPYVIWYNGRKRITEGSLSAGTSRIMWKIPEQSGFQTIQAEVLPFPPFKQDRVLNELPRGKVKEVSVAISSKGEGLGYYSKISGKERQNSLIHWYQFLGDLRDSLVSSTDRGTLKASQAPGWEPAGGIYGITIGPNDVYELPSMRFNVSEEATGRGQLFFRFKPLNDGPILRAFFKEIGKSTSGVELKVSYKKASSLLIMSLEDEKAQEQSSVKVPEKEDYVNAIVSFNLRGKSFGVSLKIEGSGGASEEKVLFPSRTLSGEGLIQLGTIPVQGGQGSRSPVIILDELAVHYVVEPDPPPPAEIVEDQSENEVKTDKTVNENAPNNKDTLTTAEVAGEEKLL